MTKPITLAPIAKLVVVLNVSEETMSTDIGRGPAMATLAELRMFPGVNIRLGHGDRQVVQAPEISVITIALAGQSRVQRMMNVVAPLSVEPKATYLAGPHN